MRLYYYSHRYNSPDPTQRAANLLRAYQRLGELRARFQSGGIHLWAPWMDLAVGQRAEGEVWSVLHRCLLACDGIVLDLDGSGPSKGMVRERLWAEDTHVIVELP